MKILIIEDNEYLRSALEKGFNSRGYTVNSAEDGAQAVMELLVNSYDLAVVDINLPKKNGFEIAKKIRMEKNMTPLLALTARDSLKDKLVGFDGGFDDYLTKPFEFSELFARVDALIRRSKPQKNVDLKIGDLILKSNIRKVFISKKEISLTKIEYNILEYLLRKKGNAATNEELIEHIWHEDADLTAPPVRSHIKNLRKKIQGNYIQTINGVGYKIE
ncbi:MAG TPA: response regulator transcription factor [Candidatus Dojkabacteria bacterium]|jgi:DNA-binding response OmpR family regulator